MREHAISNTAIFAVMVRAAHQTVDAEPKVVVDPVSLTLAKHLQGSSEWDGFQNLSPAFLSTARSALSLRARYAEDALKELATAGPCQYLILGAGFGGLEAATSLRQKLDNSFDVTLIDKNDFFIIGFTKFDVMFGRRTAEEVKSYYKNIAEKGINFVHADRIRTTTRNTDEQLAQQASRTESITQYSNRLLQAVGAFKLPEAGREPPRLRTVAASQKTA